MKQEGELKDSIDKLEATQQKLISLRWSFCRGIFYSLGFFVGGTLIVGLVVYLLSFFDTAPIIGDYISEIIRFAVPLK